MHTWYSKIHFYFKRSLVSCVVIILGKGLNNFISVCQPGTYKDVDQCKDCVAGTYSDNVNVAQCLTCPDGTTSPAKSTIQDNCFIGKTGKLNIYQTFLIFRSFDSIND